MSNQTNELAVRNTSLATAQDFMPIMAIEQAVERYKLVTEFVKKVMIEGRDYGTIPGTEKKNPDGTPSSANNTLLKPGSEKLCTLFGLAARFEDYRIIEDFEKGHFYYAFRCVLSRNGRDVAECIGSANSNEKKYRTVSRVCPDCGKDTIKRSKPRRGERGDPGWYCWSKIGGCGATFDANDDRVTGQGEKVDPIAAADKINTLQKMAQKRAFVGATLLATNASEFFTQDVEDLPPVRDLDSDVIDADVSDAPPPRSPVNTPDLSADSIFQSEWAKAIESRNGTAEEAATLLAEHLAAKNMTLAAMHPKHRVAAIHKARQGGYDESLHEIWRRPTAGDAGSSGAPAADQKPAEPEITADLVGTWDAFENEACRSGTARGVDNGAVVAGLAAMLGKRDPAAVGTAERMTALAAIRAGTFDYVTGKIAPKPKPATRGQAA